MSSTSTSTTNNSNISSSAYRVNYSEYVADITGSPKTTRKIATTTTTTANHNNPLNNPFPNRSNPSTQQIGVMPQYGGGTDKCARCLKNVYLAEKKVGAGRAFHSSCFNCNTCRRKLDAATLSEHKGEIYCKSCYTKQYGPHGLAGGVSMSTETALLRENRSRRSSFGNDLDSTISTHSQTRPRATSSENILREEYGAKRINEIPQRYPLRYDDSSERNSASNIKNIGVDAIVNIKHESSQSPPRKDKILEPKKRNDERQSVYSDDDDRSKYIHEDETLSYSKGSSAFVNIPVVTIPKQSDSTVRQIDIPIESSRSNRQSRSRSPSITSNDSYRRQNSRERQTGITDDYFRLNLNDDNNSKANRQHSNDYTVNTIVPGNPSATGNYYHSSSSYDAKYTSTTSTSKLNDRRSPSPRNDTSRPSALNEFLSKTTITASTSPTIEKKYSAIDSLVAAARQRSNHNHDDDDDGFSY